MSDLSKIPTVDLIAEIRRRDVAALPIKTIAAQLIAAESAATGIPAAAILSRRRTPLVAAARMRCMAALYRLGFSSTQVGKTFQRCHSSVLHALKANQNLLTK